MSKKKAKGKGASADPSHEAFLTGLKGITSALVDMDFIETEYRLFVLCAEESGKLTAYALD